MIDTLKNQVLMPSNEKSGLETEKEKLPAAAPKGKDCANDIQENLENMIRVIKPDLSDEHERNKMIQEDLKRK